MSILLFIVYIQVYIYIIKCPLFFTSSQTHSLIVFMIYFSLVIIDAEKLSYVPNSHLNIIFEKYASLTYFSLFKNICMGSLYILDISLLSIMWFANIFSHSKSCLFFLYDVYLLYRSSFIWWTSVIYSYLYFFLMVHLGSYIRNHCHCHDQYWICFYLYILLAVLLLL